MNERLSASDMSSWLADEGPVHVHVGGTAIFDGAAPDFDELLAHVEERLHLVPRFRQRVTKTPLNLSNPVWSDDPWFELRRHVRRLRLPRPADQEVLRELVGEVMSEPLDKQRPPWQLYLVEGLGGGRHAIISKTHHALVDGVSAIDMGAAVLDVSPRGTELKLPRGRWRPDTPKQAFLLAQSAQDRVRGPLRAAGRVARTAVRNPADAGTRVVRTAGALSALAAGGPRVRRANFNVTIGRDRRVAWQKATLDRLRQARRPVEGATVNDVILAVAAGGLRGFLKTRREKLPEHLIALVPVSIRRPDEMGELGNRLATLFARLPIRERDPVKRLEQIQAETERLKASEGVRASTLPIEAAGWAPPTINRFLSQQMTRPLTFNLVVSNVPGPQLPLYLMGNRMREVYPFVPLSPQGHGLSIGVVSYDAMVFFGLVGDRDRVPDLDALAVAIGEALEEQVEAAGPRESPTRMRSGPRRPAARKPAKPRPKTARRSTSAGSTAPRSTAARSTAARAARSTPRRKTTRKSAPPRTTPRRSTTRRPSASRSER